MTSNRGRHFDPDILDTSIEIQEEFRRIALRYADSEGAEDREG
jgi:putative two-component system response regulator